jgi:hypothetical protein
MAATDLGDRGRPWAGTAAGSTAHRRWGTRAGRAAEAGRPGTATGHRADQQERRQPTAVTASWPRARGLRRSRRRLGHPGTPPSRRKHAPRRGRVEHLLQTDVGDGRHHCDHRVKACLIGAITRAWLASSPSPTTTSPKAGAKCNSAGTNGAGGALSPARNPPQSSGRSRTPVAVGGLLESQLRPMVVRRQFESPFDARRPASRSLGAKAGAQAGHD